MNSVLAKIVVIALSTTHAWQEPAKNAAPAAGHIVEMKCEKCLLKRAGTAAEIEVAASALKDLKLFPLDQIKCVGKGTLKLEVHKVSIEINEKHDWFPISTSELESAPIKPSGRSGRIALKGTFRLDSTTTQGSENMVTAEVPYAWTYGMHTPNELAIDVKGTEVTLASNMFDRLTLMADGHERQLVTGQGETIKTLANFEDDSLVITLTGDRSKEFRAVFSTGADGDLKLMSELSFGKKGNSRVTTSSYYRVSNLALLDDVREAASKRTASATRLAGVETIVAELDADVSTDYLKEGSEFTFTVKQPLKYAGAKLNACVDHINSTSAGIQVRVRFVSLTVSATRTMPVRLDKPADRVAAVAWNPLFAGAITGGPPNEGVESRPVQRADPETAITLYTTPNRVLLLRKGTTITIPRALF